MIPDDRATTNSEAVAWQNTASISLEERQRVLRQKMRVYPPALLEQVKAIQQARPALARAAGVESAT